MEGKKVGVKLGKEKNPRRKNGWFKGRKKSSTEPSVQNETTTKEFWWRENPDNLNQEEIVKLRDKFVQFHNSLCEELEKRLAGASSNMAVPDKVQPLGGKGNSKVENS